MKKITQEEFNSLALKSGSLRNRLCANEAIKKDIKTLGVGEMVLITKDEWVGKTSPMGTVNSWFKDIRFKTRTLVDDSGWVVTRIS